MLNSKVTIKVPHRDGRRNIFHRRITQMPGTLVPIWHKELLPNTEITQKLAIGVSFPPLISDTFMKCSYKVEAFFVPLRLCAAGFENWWTQKDTSLINADDSDISSSPDYIPYITIPVGPDVDDNIMQEPVFQSYYSGTMDRRVDARGTLLNYLGVKYGARDPQSTWTGGYPVRPFEMVAYHLIWQHWYRAPLVQRECFGFPSYNDNGSGFSFGTLPFYHSFSQTVISAIPDNVFKFTLADGCSLFQLRQRNYGFDYFTQAYPTASQPNMSVPIVNNAFTIASLRNNNSLQQWGELHQLAGNRLVDRCKAEYGANLKDGVAQRPIFLGSADYEILSHGVSITAQNIADNLSRNPFSDGAAGRLGQGYGAGSDFIIDHFTAQEPGIIMVIGSLVPRATYGSGVPRSLMRYTEMGFGPDDRADYPSFMLQNVGNEPIFQYELAYERATNKTAVFGYTERYADWFNDLDDAVGEFGYGASLSSFVLQRVFTQQPQVNSAFLEINTSDMDNITALESALSGYGCWVDVDFDTRYLIPLYSSSMPSLQNPAYEHGKSVGGFRTASPGLGKTGLNES